MNGDFQWGVPYYETNQRLISPKIKVSEKVADVTPKKMSLCKVICRGFFYFDYPSEFLNYDIIGADLIPNKNQR